MRIFARLKEMCICFEGKCRFDWKERGRSPYHLKIGLDCFRTTTGPPANQPASPPVHQSDQIYCEDFVIVIVIIVIVIIIIIIIIGVIMIIITFRLYERYCSRIQSDQGREGGLL